MTPIYLYNNFIITFNKLRIVNILTFLILGEAKYFMPYLGSKKNRHSKFRTE